MLTRFWERVDLGGRNRDDANLFKLGEEVFPMGPPRMFYGLMFNGASYHFD